MMMRIKQMRACVAAIACAAALVACAWACACVSCAWADDSASSSDQTTDQSATAINEQGSNLIEPSQRADNSFVYDISIGDLTSSGEVYEGKEVQIQGEVVGDKVNDSSDSNCCWVVVSSLGNEGERSDSISVYMSQAQASQIDTFGRYGLTGTTVSVLGEYHQVCDLHDGAMDIHAAGTGQVTIMKAGSTVDHPVQMWVIVVGIVLIALAAALSVAFYIMRERSR